MRPGDLVVANVRLERLLSEGGMGSVWVASHLTLNTEVAVKFMGADKAADPDAIARFKREASAAAQIKSPHIVQVFDHGLTAEGIPYIVMELLHGEDLETRLARGPLAVGDTLLVIRHLCKALARAHQQGIVHRDIKPANLFLVDADGDVFVKVLDFGIAKRTVEDALVSSKTQTGTMMGTPNYMSPEQMMGTTGIDARSDLWAAAVVAYVCLTGVVPFDGETIGSLAVVINAAVFVPVTARMPGLPWSLDAWFARALARSPDARFQSAKEMADALTAAVPKELRSVRPAALPSAEPEGVPLSHRRTVDVHVPPAAAGGRTTSPLTQVTPPPMRIRALDAIAEEPEPRRSWTIPIALGLAVVLVAGVVALRGRQRPEPVAALASPPTATPVASLPAPLPQAAPPPPVASAEPSLPVASAEPSLPVASAEPSLPVASAEPPLPVASAEPPTEVVGVAPAETAVPASSNAKASPPAAIARVAPGGEPPRHAASPESSTPRVRFTALAVPELPQIAAPAGATVAAAPAKPSRADAGSTKAPAGPVGVAP